MSRSFVPDLERPGRLPALAAATGVVVAAVLFVHMGLHVGANLGDTDDATRLVIVRDLLHGRGWFDQRITRLQPPQGVWLHWSRLLDGGIAAMDRLYAVFLPPARAEWLTRVTWPLVWVFVGLAGVFAATRRLVGPAGLRDGRLASLALVAVAVLSVVDLVLYYAQFHPGRIDHHSVQIALCVVAAAGAMQSDARRRGAIVCGVASGLGVAVGLEALIFEAVLAVAFALRWLGDAREGPRTATYGVALAVTTALAFVAQTPPARWFTPACDALAVNLLAGAVVGGGGLALATWAGRRGGFGARLAALAVVAMVALAAYLALDRNCLHGPFADVDPRIRPFWLDHVQEMKRFSDLWKTSRPDAVDIATFSVMGALAWAALGFDRARRRDPAWMIAGAMLAIGIAFALQAVRARAYAEWFSLPPLAVCAALLGRRFRSVGPFVGTLVVAAALAPVVAVGLFLIATRSAFWQKPAAAHRPDPADHCFDAWAYRDLARLPPGLVVSEVDLGPFVLAHTRDSALSAPYHRMTDGLLRARSMVAARATDRGPAGAEARARAVGATYVLECRVHARHADRSGLKPDTLQMRLDHGAPPPWLVPLSPKDAPLQVYGLRATPGVAPSTPSGSPSPKGGGDQRLLSPPPLREVAAKRTVGA